MVCWGGADLYNWMLNLWNLMLSLGRYSGIQFLKTLMMSKNCFVCCWQGTSPPKKTTLEPKLGRVGVSRGWKKMYKSLSHVNFMVVSQVGILCCKTIMLLLLFLFPLCFIFFSNPEHLFLILFSSSLLSLSSQKFCELRSTIATDRESYIYSSSRKSTQHFSFSLDGLNSKCSYLRSNPLHFH